MPCSPRNSSGSSLRPAPNRPALLSELQRIRTDLQFQEDSLLALERDLRDREARVAELSRMLEAQKSAGEALKAKLSDALFAFRNRGLEVEERDGKVYVRLASKLLFASGSTAIDPDGREASIGLARAIEGETGFEIVVEGHTDDVAFNRQALPATTGNSASSGPRLWSRCSPPTAASIPALLTAAGRSEFHPRDPRTATGTAGSKWCSARNWTDCTTCWTSDQLIGSRKEPWAMLMPPVPSLPIRLPPKVPTTMPPASGRI